MYACIYLLSATFSRRVAVAAGAAVAPLPRLALAALAALALATFLLLSLATANTIYNDKLRVFPFGPIEFIQSNNY